jgi:L-lactate dehydrogenase complex protein LldG
MSREQMLARLRDGLSRRRDWFTELAAAAPHSAPPFVHAAQADLSAQFAAELQRLEARVYQVPDAAAALPQIAALLDQCQSGTTLLGWDAAAIGLPGLSELLTAHGIQLQSPDLQQGDRQATLATLEPLRVGLTGVDLAIAESGTLLLRHGPGRPRVASLLTPCHIAIVFADQLVRGLGEALQLLQQRHQADLFGPTSNLTLITGPSRTADIEMTLSLGIHGPPQLHVVLVGESYASARSGDPSAAAGRT